MKGIELPVNVLVVISIAVLVMLGMIALYVAGTQGMGPMAMWATKNSACADYIGNGCSGKYPSVSLDIDHDDTADDTLDELCALDGFCAPEDPDEDPNTFDIITDPVELLGKVRTWCGCPNA